MLIWNVHIQYLLNVNFFFNLSAISQNARKFRSFVLSLFFWSTQFPINEWIFSFFHSHRSRFLKIDFENKRALRLLVCCYCGNSYRVNWSENVQNVLYVFLSFFISFLFNRFVNVFVCGAFCFLFCSLFGDSVHEKCQRARHNHSIEFNLVSRSFG